MNAFKKNNHLFDYNKKESYQNENYGKNPLMKIKNWKEERNSIISLSPLQEIIESISKSKSKYRMINETREYESSKFNLSFNNLYKSKKEDVYQMTKSWKKNELEQFERQKYSYKGQYTQRTPHIQILQKNQNKIDSKYLLGYQLSKTKQRKQYYDTPYQVKENKYPQTKQMLQTSYSKIMNKKRPLGQSLMFSERSKSKTRHSQFTDRSYKQSVRPIIQHQLSDNLIRQKKLKILSNYVYKPQLQFNNGNKILFKSNLLIKKPVSNFNIISKNDFLISSCKGEGRFGKVYMAIHKQTNMVVALKQMKKSDLSSIKEQFVRQLKIQSYLFHPHIVKVYGYFDTKDCIYTIMEYMQEGSLYSKLKKQKKFAVSQVKSIIRQVCDAVQEVHSKEVLHRDIKPQNVVLTQGVCKICDFGWAVYSDERRKTYCGTLDYVCPEILEGETYNNMVDIWAVGVMAYQLLKGQTPFYHISKKETIDNIKQCQLKFDEGFPVKAKDFILKALKKNIVERYSIQCLVKHPFLVENKQN